MHATQQRILEILQEQGSGIVRDLARWLDVKPPSLRYHLSALEEGGYIERISLPSSGDVGRPAVHYALTPDGIRQVQHCAPWLVEGLLSQIRFLSSPDEMISLFQNMGQQLAHDFASEDWTEMPLMERLQRASQTLSAYGYGATVTQKQADDESALFLQTRNCPYGDLPQEHQELCQMDLALVSELVGRPCSPDQNLAQGDNCCTFQLAGPSVTDIDLA